LTARGDREIGCRVPYTYSFPRPAVTCDAVVFTMRADDLAVLLVQRMDEPFKGRWALPGGFVNENEALARAVARELYEETGVSGLRFEQLAAFGDPGRDPRGHVVTIAWVTFLVAEAKITAGSDAAAAQWQPFRSLALDEVPVSHSVPPPPPAGARKASRGSSPSLGRRGTPARALTKARRSLRPSGPVRLAFDHARIVTRAHQRLCRHLEDPLRDTTFDLVPPRFTLAELQRIYEVVLARRFTPRIFKRHFVEGGLVVPATSKPAPKPAAQLYRWNRR
jgi:8-oxo-dGTP diphosphatase